MCCGDYGRVDGYELLICNIEKLYQSMLICVDN